MSIYNKTIGIENESCLHRSLKYKYTGLKGKTEVETGEYIADGINADGEFIEIQTGSFAPLINKVKEFTTLGKMRIIHPIALNTIIEMYESTDNGKPGKLIYKRKSPHKRTLWNFFDALVYAPLLPLTRGLCIEVVMVDVTEKRINDGKGARRRKGISIMDRELTSWYGNILFKKKSDYLRFIPFKKGEEFTSIMLAETAGITNETARKTLYVLTKMSLVSRTGKKSNLLIYTRNKR
jgi:hypothetical protein